MKSKYPIGQKLHYISITGAKIPVIVIPWSRDYSPDSKLTRTLVKVTGKKYKTYGYAYGFVFAGSNSFLQDKMNKLEKLSHVYKPCNIPTGCENKGCHYVYNAQICEVLKENHNVSKMAPPSKPLNTRNHRIKI